MIRRFKKQLSLLFAGSFSMALAACYGAPYEVNNITTIKTVNTQNEPIQGLKVTLLNNNISQDEGITGSNGELYFDEFKEDLQNDFNLKIEDIDSTENGLYKDKEFDITYVDTDYIITIEEKK